MYVHLVTARRSSWMCSGRRLGWGQHLHTAAAGPGVVLALSVVGAGGWVQMGAAARLVGVVRWAVGWRQAGGRWGGLGACPRLRQGRQTLWCCEGHVTRTVLLRRPLIAHAGLATFLLGWSWGLICGCGPYGGR